ncbi:MAG: Hg(II)-responsive transcriptional regulator [Thiobacillus sp.]
MSQPTIAWLAREAAVNVETIRFYQRKNLLNEPPRPLGGVRHYKIEDVARVRFIKSAQRIGFTLAEIAVLLQLEDGTHCREAQAIATHKLEDVQSRIAELQRMAAVLQELVQACGSTKGKIKCPLIAALQG